MKFNGFQPTFLKKFFVINKKIRRKHQKVQLNSERFDVKFLKDPVKTS